jgi:predicted porin
MTLRTMWRPAAMLAALGLAAGAAQAQVDYGAYGVLDLSYGRFEASGQVPRHRYNSNSLTATFVGVNAKYGFDGGWAPGITLETFLRFQDRDTGRNDNDPLLSRNAFVSLASPYGLLRAGRLQSFLFDATVRFNAMGNSVAFSPAVRHLFASGNLEGVQGDFYWDRAASYQSPSLEGVSFSLMHGQPEDDAEGGLTGGSLIVNRGLLAVGLSAQRVEADDGIADPTDETAVQLGATYNFGLARVFVQYTATRDVGLDVRSKIASAGVNFALGPGNVLAQFATSTTEGPAVDRKHTSTSLAYVYAYDSVTDFYVIGMDDRVRRQTRGLSAAIGARYRF